MDAPGRRTETPLIGALLAEAPQFEFFQAIRLLEAACRDAAPIGGLGPVEDEALRCRANASLGFPAADIARLERVPREGREDGFVLTANFLGLYGPASPLPPNYTEAILEADPEESVLRPFLDLFNHRLFSLTYRCWVKYRYYLQYRSGGTDSFSAHLFALVGLFHPELRRDGFMEWAKLIPYAGLLGMQTCSGPILAGIIQHYYDGVPASVEECVSQEVPIEPAQRSRLGLANCSLGEDVLLGETVADLGGKFRIHLGPLETAHFRSFLPGGDQYRSLQKLVSFVLTDNLAYDVALELPVAETPELCLADSCKEGLGWSTWLGRPQGRSVEVLLEMMN